MARSIPLGIAAIALLAITSCTSTKTASNTGSTKPERVEIKVTEQGFEPAVVNVRAGQPVTLVVTRMTDQTCATELVMKDRGVNEPLPLKHAVEIPFRADQPGDVSYACGMGMFKGTVHVQ